MKHYDEFSCTMKSEFSEQLYQAQKRLWAVEDILNNPQSLSEDMIINYSGEYATLQAVIESLEASHKEAIK